MEVETSELLSRAEPHQTVCEAGLLAELPQGSPEVRAITQNRRLFLGNIVEVATDFQHHVAFPPCWIQAVRAVKLLLIQH